MEASATKRQGEPVRFIVLRDIFWHQSPCNLKLRAGEYAAVPTLSGDASGTSDPVRWVIRKETSQLTMSGSQARYFEASGQLRIER